MDSQKQHEVGKQLKDILAARRLHKRPLSGGSKRLLREAVLQLIDHHQQFDLLIKESSSLQNLHLHVPREKTTSIKPDEANKDADSSKTHGQFSVDLCISYLKAQSQSTGVPLATLAATTCVAKLSDILQQSKDVKSLFLTPDAKNAVSSILNVVARLKETHSFDRMQFVKELTSKDPLPLELLWQLHIKSIMTFDLFITSNLGQPQVFTAFTSDVGRGALMCVEEENDTCNDIMKDITQFFIVHGYGARIEAQDSSPSVAAVQKACVVLLDTIVERILDNPEEKGRPALAKLLARARGNPSVPSECLVKFFAHVLVLVLSHRADITVKDAIATQEQWSFGRAPPGVTSMYRELLLAMECKDAMGIIQRVLEREEVNWKSLLTFSATLLVCFQEAPQMIKDMIDTLLNQSLESCEQDSLIAAFLLARQAANEGPHVFQSYQQWFREQLGEGASHLSNKKAVAFFLAFLTSLVPHEPAEYLKAHVKNQPHVPSKCRESLADYNSLAKTRLADLKVPLDSEGIFSSTSGGSPGQKQSGKTQRTTYLFSGPLWAAATTFYSSRILTFFGGLLTGVGFISVGFAGTPLQLSIALLLTGIGMGLPMVSVQKTVRDYFDADDHNFSVGMIFVGSAVGMTIFPPISELLIDKMGWRNASILLGASCFNICVGAALFKPLQEIVSGTLSKGVSKTSGYRQLKTDDISKLQTRNTEKEKSAFVDHCFYFSGFSSIVEEPIICIYFAAFILWGIAYTGWVIFLFSFAIALDFTPKFASILSAIGGIGTFAGRLTTTVLFDRIHLSAQMQFVILSALSSLALFLYLASSARWALITVSFLAGIGIGTPPATMVLITKDILSAENYSSGLGLLFFFQGIGMVAGGPLTGFIYDMTDGLNSAFFSLAIAEIIAAVLALIKAPEITRLF